VAFTDLGGLKRWRTVQMPAQQYQAEISATTGLFEWELRSGRRFLGGRKQQFPMPTH